MAIGELVARHAVIKAIVLEAKAIVKKTELIMKEVEEIMRKLKAMSEGSFADILQQKIQKLANVFKILIEAFLKILDAVFEGMEKLANIDKNGASNYGASKI